MEGEVNNATSMALPILSSLVALAAVIIGPLVQLVIAKKQIAASTISSNRQVWIDELRKEVAEFLMISSHLEGLRHTPSNLTDKQAERLMNERIEVENRSLQLIFQITLRLNPNENLHNDLVKNFSEMANASEIFENSSCEVEMTKAINEFREARQRAMQKSQEILKSEWERVKRGE